VDATQAQDGSGRVPHAHGEIDPALLTSFVEGSADAIVVLRPDGTVRLWNRGAEELYGWSAQEMLGQSVFRLVPEAARKEVESHFERVTRSGVSAEMAGRRVRKDGRVVDVALTVTPLRDARGRIEGLASVERDVTRRRRFEVLADGQRRMLETLSQSGRLQDGLRDLLDTLLELTAGRYAAAVMKVETERLLLVPAASRLPESVERTLTRGIALAPDGHPAGEAAFHRQAVSVADLRRAEGWQDMRQAAVEAGLLSCCAAPIIAPGGEVLGTLDLYGRVPGEPSGDDLEVATALARTAALAIQRFETVRELRLGREVLIALNDIHAQLLADLDLGRIFRRVTEEATRLVGAQMGAFFTSPSAPGSEAFELHSVAGPRAERFAGLALPRNTALFSQTLTGHVVQRFTDVTKDPRYGKNAPLAGLPDGHPPVRSFMSAPVAARSGEVIGMLLIGHEEPARFSRWHEDILRGVASQTALAVDSAHLYRQASERAEALAQADRRKDQFLAILGHELRNPLGAMVASLAVMESGLKPDVEDALEALTIFRRQSRHMQRLIDDLLDINRITRGRIPLRRETVDACTAVRQVVDTVRIPALKLRQKIELDMPDEPVWIDADPVRFEQIVGNLVHNAMKFSPRGATTHVEVSQYGHEASIVVRDEGRGIPPDRLQDIFEMFTQVQRPDHPSSGGGLGIGLTLVREIVQLHGGWVTARSKGPGTGSEFEIRLPAVDAPPDDLVRETPARPRPTAVLRVLLAEDQPDAARAMVMLLRHWGHRVVHVETGPEALEQAHARRPDVCLLDIGLPGMDGWTLARELRALPDMGAVRLAALSGLGQEMDEAASAEAGFERHFVKPADPDVLKTWLEEVAAGLTP
jgi:two-component system CheB/CheR fusion protein